MDQRRVNDNHLRRLRPPESQQPPPPQQPQKCPRCDSLNTKFCYYNNYSLSQPRYFCKTCRRYWTQGGTLRNVPVGGGCRKGKRAKPSPSIGDSSPIVASRSESSVSQIQLGHTSLGIPSSRYPGGGFLSSLAAMQSFSQTPPPPPQPYNTATTNQQSINMFGLSSNLDLLRGFNSSSSATTTTDQTQQEAQFYQLDQNPFEIQPNRPLSNLWSQTQLLNPTTTTNPNNYWSSTAAAASSATNAAATNTSTSGSSPLNLAPWPHLPADYGNPP